MTDSLESLQVALGGDYLLERQLGRGGMGAVYLARDTRLDRQVAIKVLPSELSTNADLRERFIRETRVAASFSHPNIVPVHAIEERPGLLAFVMGYVEGETLGARVQRGPLAIPDAVRIIQEVAWALSYAHGRGIVHRDIKPDNVLIERVTGRALVTDFGIARTIALTPGQGLTRVGEVVGTPQFMSPEQAAGDVVDGRSDIYSLGIVTFHALTGTLPFDAGTPTALLAMHLTQPPPLLAARRPDVPEELASAVARCLEKSPDARWPTAEALASALDRLRRSAPEVAAPVRIFLQRFNSALTGGVLMLVLASSMFPARGAAISVDHMILLVIVIAVAGGVLLSGFRRIRGVMQQGYRYRDIAAATNALIDEEQAARDAIRASAPEMKRRRRNIRVGIFSLVWPVLMLYAVRTWMRTPVVGQPGRYAVSLPGVYTVLAAAAAFGLGFAILVSDPLKPNPFVRLQRAFWHGPAGRTLFRLYGRGLPSSQSTATGASAVAVRAGPGSGAMTLIAALPRDVRQQLGAATRALAAHEGEMDTAAARERELNAALAELGMTSTTPGLAAAQDATSAEIRGHLAALQRRREAITTAAERTRLELVRLRAGIGSTDAVNRAAQLQ